MVFAITGDVPVVAAVVGVAFGAVTALQVFERKVFVTAGCTAVKDNPFHFLHWESFYLFHKRILLEVIPIRGATLDCQSSQNSCYHCCSEFQNLCDFGPIYFYHFILKLNLTYKFLLSLAQRKKQRDIHPLQGLPLYGEDANKKLQSYFFYVLVSRDDAMRRF